ncbi:MAG: precorrin-2 C(20)-methyltransferase [Burkholderia sp.]|nr:precorrin-2 C(20)-methyltransferase [Burkholderia sp.]
MIARGCLFGLGVGPGDPELITLKTLRLLKTAQVVAYFVAKGKTSNALRIIKSHLLDKQIRLPLIYPITTEILPSTLYYESVITNFYDTASNIIAVHLNAGRNVAVICEGDPFFYGSYMYLHDRLSRCYDTNVVPGVCSMLGSAAVLSVPLVYRNQTLSVLSGMLPENRLRSQLAQADAAVVMKLGRNFSKVRRVLDTLMLIKRALYIEHATTVDQRIVPINEVDPMVSPYFSLLIIPGKKWKG